MAQLMKYPVLFLIFLINTVDKLLQLFGIKLFKLTQQRVLGSLTSEQLVETTQSDVEEPFKIFIKGLEEDENLSLVRRFLVLKMIGNVFDTRVQIKQTLRDKPEILEIPVRRPIFIIGMPRTGTTLLSRLMGEDPAVRAPTLWEMAFPCPPGKVENYLEDERYKKARVARQLDDWEIGEGAKKIHITKVDEPEECLTFTRLQFWQYFHHLRIPALHEHEDWFLKTDHNFAKQVYEYYKKQLQLLSYGNEPRNFLLKCNVHLLALEALLEVFPDACLIYTFRPMSEAVASFCSTMDQLFSFYGKVDLDYGRRVLRLCAELTNRGAKSFEKFDQLPANQNPLFITSFKSLAADPFKTLKNIYSHFNLKMDLKAESRLKKYIEDHPRNKHGVHNYSLSQYGLNIDDLYREMAPYIAYFKKKGYSDII